MDASPSPPDWSTLVTLPDNSPVVFRRKSPVDEPAILQYKIGPTGNQDPSTVTFIAMHQQAVIAMGAYTPTDPEVAEVEITVAPEFLAQSVGAFMLQLLAAHAYAASIRTFTTTITDKNIALKDLAQAAKLGARFTPGLSETFDVQLNLEHCAPLVNALRSQALFHTSPHPLQGLLQNLQSQRDQDAKQL